jgi:membrane-associated phospholipid phosphatase
MQRALPEVIARRTDPAERYGLRLTLAVAAIVLVAVPFSYLLFEVLDDGALTRVDADVAERLNGLVHSHSGWVGVLEAISWLGRPPTLALLTVVGAVVTGRQRARRLTVFLLATTLGGAVLSTAVKVLVDRPRPEVHHPIVTAFGKSFPSGHALSSTVVLGALLLTFLPVVARPHRRLVVGLVVLLVLAIGSSRVLLGVHFVTDVLAGHLLGLAWLLASTAVFQTWRVERGRRPSHPLEEGVEPEAALPLSDLSDTGTAQPA